MKKIVVFTGTRAEYGLMKTLIKKLDKDKYFEFNLLISASHLDSKFGNTIEEIKNDGIPTDFVLPIDIDINKKSDMSFQTSEVIKQVSISLDKLNPEYLIILGDRFESFGAAAAGHLLGVKNIHLHGGETSLGALDDKLRHAISQLSTIHFTSAEIHKKKVEEMVGSSSKVFNIGPLVMDGFLNLQLLSKKDFQKRTGFVFSNKNFIVTFHPETLSADFGISGLENLLKCLKDKNCNVLFTAPNADAGSDLVLKIIKDFINLNNNNNKYLFIPSLGQELYLNALLLFDCVVGNSSSGIVEAPLVEANVLNIGDRQKGRYRFGSVIDVDNSYISISNAINDVLGQTKKLEFNYKSLIESIKKNSPSNKIIQILKNKNLNL